MNMQHRTISLLVDAGNTRVKIGWLNHTTRKREPDTLAAPLDQLETLIDDLERALGSDITATTTPGTGEPDHMPGATLFNALGVSSAASQVMQHIQNHLLQRFGTTISWLRSCRVAAGMLSEYDPPDQLGSDRWAAMLGMMQNLETRPLLLASFGTATTIDTLYPATAISHTNTLAATAQSSRNINQPNTAHMPANLRAVFAGGLILPGPQLMLQSLATGTAHLPLAQASASSFPTHTHQAIYSGMLAAQTGAVLRQWREIRARFGVTPQVFCSGGGFTKVRHELQRVLELACSDARLAHQQAQWVPNPVLDGLAYLAQQHYLPEQTI